jgi:hypothetical protein
MIMHELNRLYPINDDLFREMRGLYASIETAERSAQVRAANTLQNLVIRRANETSVELTPLPAGDTGPITEGSQDNGETRQPGSSQTDSGEIVEFPSSPPKGKAGSE